MEILFVHMLNNYTGSPNVLANFLKEYSQNKTDIHLLTSKTNGFLSSIDKVKIFDNKYKWTENRILLTIIFVFSQMYQFFFVLFGKKYDCVYLNTILPFGAALAAKLRKIKTVYHVHEYYPNPHLMQKICVYIASRCGDKYIFVSEYLRKCYEGIFVKNAEIIHNAVSKDFHVNASKKILVENYLEQKFNGKTIVLPCALKKYKGVNLLVNIAKKLPEYNFLLVTSNSKEETNNYFASEKLPSNLLIKNQVSDMSEIYSNATLVVNLSIPHGVEGIIETFSMILIEAFEYKTPCIAPCYGGPLEIIKNEYNGFLLEVENQDEIVNKIKYLFSDFNVYKAFSENAYLRSKDFSTKKFFNSIYKIIQGE